MKFGVPLNFNNPAANIAASTYQEQLLGSGTLSSTFSAGTAQIPSPTTFFNVSGWASVRLIVYAKAAVALASVPIQLGIAWADTAPSPTTGIIVPGAPAAGTSYWVPNGLLGGAFRADDSQAVPVQNIGVAVIDIPVESPLLSILFGYLQVGATVYNYSWALYGTSRQLRGAIQIRQPWTFSTDANWISLNPELLNYTVVVSDVANHVTPLPVIAEYCDISLRIITGSGAVTATAKAQILPDAGFGYGNGPVTPILTLGVASSTASFTQGIKLPPFPCALNFNGAAAVANDTSFSLSIVPRGSQ